MKLLTIFMKRSLISRSRNVSQIFENFDENIFVISCYNGSGISITTFLKKQKIQK